MQPTTTSLTRLFVPLGLIVAALFTPACGGSDSAPAATASAETPPSPEATRPAPRSPWAGTYQNPWGVRLTLAAETANTLSGELTVTTDGVESGFPVQLTVKGAELEGSFESSGSAFPLHVAEGEESAQIVVTSEGNVYELEREGGRPANPLAPRGNTPQNPLASNASPATSASTPAARAAASRETGVPSAQGANYHHPDGYFSMKVPAKWRATMHTPDVIEFETDAEGEIVLAVIAELDEDEIGQPVLDITRGAIEAIDEFLGDELGMRVDSDGARINVLEVGPLAGGTNKRYSYYGPTRWTTWQGTLPQAEFAVVLVATMTRERERSLINEISTAFKTLRIHEVPAPGSFPEEVEEAPAPGRNVVFNGKRLSSRALADLEQGSAGVIGDGEYWYDRMSGMAGTQDGPTLAYLAPGLRFCGAIKADASGNGTRVALNGRFLHAEDLDGLQAFFGQLNPGYYWMDGQGNFGVEGRPASGNLVQEIAAMQALLAQRAPSGQGNGTGYGNQGYTGYGGGGSGGRTESVYTRFPNLGASGTGVSVADVGGGDTIVNAGGVLWWPGK